MKAQQLSAPAFKQHSVKSYLIQLHLACLVGYAAVASAQTFTGYLDVGGTATQVIPITLAHDGQVSLNITVGPYLNLNINTAVGVNAGVIVYDSTGTNRLYGASQGQGTTVNHVVNGLGAGNYFVRLTAIGNFAGLGWGNYTMVVSESPDPLPNDAEPNDDFEHALTATLNSTVTGHLGYLGPQSVIEKQDFWWVSIPSDGTLHLDIATGTRLNLNQNSSVGATGGVMVYDSDRSTSFYSAVQGERTTNTHSIPKLKAGEYYIRLTVIGSLAGYYGSYVLTPRHTPEVVPNDSEQNDQPSQAGALVLNALTTGHLGYYGGGGGTNTDVQDWFVIALPQPGNLELDVVTTPLLNLNANAAIGASGGITVLDSDAATVLFAATQGQNTTNTHVAQRLKPGVYYVRLAKLNQAGYYGGYRLTPRLISVPEDPENNDDAPNASVAAIGSTVQGNLGYRGGGLGLIQDQLDWWKFSMPSTGQVQLVITTYGNLNLNINSAAGANEGITVFSSTAGNEVGTRLFGTTQGQGTTRTNTLNLGAGDYYLRLVKLADNSYWGTYTVTLNYIGAPIINCPATARGLAGRPFDYTITVLGGGSFGVANLPSGLQLNPVSGLISGTLDSPGTHNITLLATNALGTTSGNLALTILPLPSLTIQAAAQNHVTIVWPTDYADFKLFSSSTLDGSSTWEAVSPLPVTLGDRFAVTNLLEHTPRFYRLKQD